MAVRYVLHPGEVRSITDHDTHYIGVRQLLSLYRVPRDAAYTVYPSTEAERAGFSLQEGDVHLYPKTNGNYTLPGGQS